MLLFFLLSVVLVAADQITKALAVAYLKPVTTFPIIRDVLHLTYSENTGAAFSILNGFRWGFVILAVIADIREHLCQRLLMVDADEMLVLGQVLFLVIIFVDVRA